MANKQEVFMTPEEAESIIMADRIGMYTLDYPGNASKLAHAKLLMAALELQDVPAPAATSCAASRRGRP